LLDRSLAFAEPLGDFPNAALVHEALVNHAPLGFRELPHQPEQTRSVFDSTADASPSSLGRRTS